MWRAGTTRTLLTDQVLDVGTARTWAAQELGLPSTERPSLEGDRLRFAEASPSGAAAGPESSATQRRLSVMLVIESGPDAGWCVPLPPGQSVWGRGPHRVQVEDPSISRREAVVTVSAQGITVSSLGRSPLYVDHRPCRSAKVDERHVVRIGANACTFLPRAPLAVPHLRQPVPQVDIHEPPPPRRPWLQALAAVAPLAIGAALVVFTGQWLMLLFGLVGLLTGGVACVSDLRERRAFGRHCAAEAAAHAAGLLREHPAPGTLLAAWRRPAPAERVLRADRDLTSADDSRSPVPPVRIGLQTHASIAVRAPGLKWPSQRVAAAPSLCAPRPGERIAVMGGDSDTGQVLRTFAAVWAQAASHGLGRLTVGRSAELPAGLLRLPGVTLASPEQAAHLVFQAASTDARPVAPVHVHLGPFPGAEWVVDTVTAAVTSLRAAEGADSRARRAARRRAHSTIEGPSFRALAQALEDHESREAATDTRLADGGSGGGGARVPGPAPQSTGARPSAGVVIGSGEDGPVALDLDRDGPHALVAGSTGSGKSELLRTWITGLCQSLDAQRLRLLLFDFKGGSTFDPFAALPQVEELVTDLDTEAVARVLDSLSGELTRREVWLRTRGFSDLAEALAAEGPEELAPPRIVVVVDEFRVLAEQVPEVLDRMVRLATVGRSLGVHLLLATQRPQGIVSADIRANVNLRLCLRVQSEADSMELISTSAGAALPADRPGLCLIAIGSKPAMQCKVASVRASSEPIAGLLVGPRCSDVRRSQLTPLPGSGWEARLQAIRQASPPAPAPFVIAPLPTSLGRLSAKREPQELLLGLRAGRERLHPWRFRPGRDGHVAVLCSADAERTAMARALLDDARGRPLLAGSSVVLDGVGATDPLDPAWGLALTPASTAAADEALEALAQGHRPGAGPAIVWLLAPDRWWGDLAEPASLRREALLGAILRRQDLSVIAVGGRELLISRHLAAFGRRVHVPFGVGPETAQLWPPLRACAPVPGRGVLLSPEGPVRGELVQLRTQSRRDGTADASATPVAEGMAAGWLPLPAVATAAVPPAVAVRSLSLAPVEWAPERLGVILGAAGSGRTQALRRVAAQLPGTAQWIGRDEPLPRQLTRGHWWVLDDADSRSYEDHERISDHLRAGGRALAAARSTPHPAGRLPWWGHLDPHADVALMGPRTKNETETLGWNVPADPDAPPGRGWLTPRGSNQPVRVQWLLP